MAPVLFTVEFCVDKRDVLELNDRAGTLTAQLLLFVAFDAELGDAFDELCRGRETSDQCR